MQYWNHFGLHYGAQWISNRGNSFKITGDNENVASTSNFIERMYDLSGNEEITPKQLHLYLNNSGELLSHDYENETKHNIKLKKIIEMIRRVWNSMVDKDLAKTLD